MFGTHTITWATPPTAPAARAVPRPKRAFSGTVRGRYENALTHEENAKHWTLADFLSARSANSRDVRRTLRMRVRYEADNNSVVSGVLDTFVTDVVGTGPTLQTMMDFEADGTNDMNQLLERFFGEWYDEAFGHSRLRSGLRGKKTDGETLILKKTNRDLLSPVKFYPHGIETDQCQTVNPQFQTGFWVDGIELDDFGNPKFYHILKRHPGDVLNVKTPWGPLENERVHASQVIHWFKPRRVGEVRGVPELTPSLDVIARIRRCDKATISGMEWAATCSALLFTKLAADDQDDTEMGTPWETVELESGVQQVMPDGYEPRQLEPTQPISTYKEFMTSAIGQAARPLSMPYNIAMCDNSGMSFSGGRLNHLPYYRCIDLEREDCERIVLNVLFDEWYNEAVLIPGYLPAEIVARYPQARFVPRVWHWPPADSIDPSKDAQADEQNLANGTTSVPALCARYGRDWREVLRQRAMARKEELRLAKELGLPDDWNQPATKSITKPQADKEEPPAQSDEKEAAAA